jgi:hypothetical protein
VLRLRDIGEPLDLGRNLGQPVKLRGSQKPLGRVIGVGSWGSVGGSDISGILFLINLLSRIRSGTNK